VTIDLRAAAARHRTLLTGVTVVAVTGSCGKTTTKDLTGALLSSRLRGSTSAGSTNCGTDVAIGLLAVTSDDHFFVQELGAWGRGTLDPALELVRPRVGVVTNLRHDHFSAFRGPRGAQAEKGKLIATLPAAGTAVLNWDDPYVRELAGWTSARVLSFGRDPGAGLRATDVKSAWPAPLSFTAIHGRERVQVRTRLYGAHLVGSALAALAVGLVFGLPLEQGATALASADPTPRRMTPELGTDGVAFMRDDFKAPADSVPEVLEFMREAAARRKLAVLGCISDYAGRSRPTYTRLADLATAMLDTVVFVGPRAVELWGEHGSGSAADQDRLRREIGLTAHPSGSLGQERRRAKMYVFGSVAAASTFLNGQLRAGDLVLLKGSGPADHLERILLSRYRSVSCWRTRCGHTHGCDDCELLLPPVVTHSAGGQSTNRSTI
jgi:UDP-N-acetylmuramoyl-tripeptide--D-alanyl-D-alanine ligase